MRSITADVYNSIEQKSDWSIGVLQDLIRFKSVSGCEHQAQMYIAEILNGLGCRMDIWEPSIEELKAYPGFLTQRNDYNGSPNVVGTLKGNGGGRSIILNGHIDVVPADEAVWSRNPWSGDVMDGRVFGRGASDMKGGTVSFLSALKALKEAGIDLQGDVIVESVIEEEAGGAGTLACAHRGYKADGAVIPEPTDLQVYTASMGSMWFRVSVKGKAAHGATAYHGVNAVEKSYKIIDSLRKLEERRTGDKRHKLYSHVPVPFCINVGRIYGGNWPSSVPEESVIEGRMGVAPQETLLEARSDLEAAIAETASTDPWMKDHPPVIEWFGSCWNSGEVSADDPIVLTLLRNIKSYAVQGVQIKGAPWATDAGTLIRFADTPTVVFGPGTGSLAHQTDEYIEIEHIKTASKIFAGLLLEWCGHEV